MTRSETGAIRAEENGSYRVAKAGLEQGLGGVRKALEVLCDYYGGAAAMPQEDEAKFSSFMQRPAPPQQRHGLSASPPASPVAVA